VQLVQYTLVQVQDLVSRQISLEADGRGVDRVADLTLQVLLGDDRNAAVGCRR
jgi:hypothetical protein